jgi:excisionase family DNA binding protein
MSNKLLSVEEAAERLGIKRGTLYHWIPDGKIKYVKIGRMRRFRESDIDAFIEENTVPARGELRF